MKALYLGLRLLRPADRAGLARVLMIGLGAAIGTAVILGLLSVPGVVDAQSERLSRQVPNYVESDSDAPHVYAQAQQFRSVNGQHDKGPQGGCSTYSQPASHPHKPAQPK